jgi:4-hydroxybenzoate polyprenyltransferase
METGSLVLREKVRGFFGLSRMTHSILDIAHPAIGAVLVLGGFPRPSTAIIGLLAAFAGFTAVFGLNDVMDCGVDCEKMAKDSTSKKCFDIDSVGYRHPIAQGSMAFKSAVAWVVFWGLCALSLAFVLNPVCAALMVAAVGLEMGYCRLLRVTHWKALLSGLMVAVGGLAGVYAVAGAPPLGMVDLFVLWAFAWEVGCRNIPNDWSDLDEDINLRIRTIPVRYGRLVSSWISFVLLCLTVASSLLFPLVIPVRHPIVYTAGALASGAVLLVIPAVLWVRSQRTESAMYLFNRACFYPLTVFALVAVLAAF